MPANENDWRKIAKDFEAKWDFPHCLGAINGRHIRIAKPPNSGSYFLNYKEFHSIVLLACVNANYEFIWCNVGTNGIISDGEAIEGIPFYHKLENKKLHIPEEEPINGTAYDFPFVFVTDEAFPLTPDLIQPYPQENLTREKRVFNHHLARVQKIVNNVFGIMASRFRVFPSKINLSVERTDIIILTCCLLHNFLLRKSTVYTIDEPNVDDPSTAMTPIQNTNEQQESNDADLVRKLFSDYFNGEIA